MPTRTEKRDQLRRLIEGIDIAMFTTIGEDGFPVSRPLSTQDAEFDGEVLWFFVRRDTPKVREIGRDPRVNVAYASKDANVYVSVAGRAELVDDRALIDLFWNDALKAYFGKGRDDPNLALIRVTVHSAQYWEGPSTGIGKLIAFVMARVTKDDRHLGGNHLLRMREKPAVRKAGGGIDRRFAVPKRAAKSAAATSAAATSAATKRTAKKAAVGKAAVKKAAAKKTPTGKTAAKKPSRAKSRRT